MAVPDYLLDTNVLLHLVRGRDLGRHIDERFELSGRLHMCLVSIVSHGEVWGLAETHRWGEAKRDVLANMLENVVTVDIDNQDIVSAYVEMYVASRRQPKGSKSIDHNDLWIAATAKVANATLLTTDKDFDHLHPEHVTRVFIDPRRF